MKSVSLILIAGISFLLAVACDTPQQHNPNATAGEKNRETFHDKENEKEAHFVASAIENKFAEIKLAELASTKSTNKAIQDFAQQLVNDHTKALTMFKALAERKGIAVPLDEGESGKKKVNELAGQVAPDFDKKWCDVITSMQKKSIREFESMYEKSADAELMELINETLMDLRAQRERLNALENKIL